MARGRRSGVELAARRELGRVLLREGVKVRAARKRRRWRQVDLAQRAGMAQPSVSDIERGRGGSMALETWQQVALVLGLSLELTLGRDPREEPADAGHLAIEELVLRLPKPLGFRRMLEMSTKPSDPSLSTDVGLADDRNRVLIQVECVNTFGNVNAAVRSSDRKRAQAEALAIATGYGEPYAVRQCWVIRATRRNRELLVRYPESFASRFTGSSRAWVATLTAGAPPPADPGLVWCDVGATRLFEWRRKQ